MRCEKKKGGLKGREEARVNLAMKPRPPRLVRTRCRRAHGEEMGEG